MSENNSGMIVRNNIVAGTWHHGFHFVPKRCNDNNPDFVFENNVAHSISGYGAIAKNVRNDCTLVENFVAYKVTETSIMLGGASKINRGQNLKAIDTRYGIGIFSVDEGTAEILNSQVYGELTDNMDCPQGSPCDHCMTARGIILNLPSEGEHRDREEKSDMLPLFNPKGGAMNG